MRSAASAPMSRRAIAANRMTSARFPGRARTEPRATSGATGATRTRGRPPRLASEGVRYSISQCPELGLVQLRGLGGANRGAPAQPVYLVGDGLERGQDLRAVGSQ